MRIQRLVYLSFVAILLTNEKSHAQTLNFSAKEDRLVRLYSKLEDHDSADVYSEKFGKELASFIKNNPATLTYPFKKFSDSIFSFLHTSDDGNFRIYSWDSETGGSMHFYKVIYQ